MTETETVPTETRSTVDIAVEREVAVRRLQEELSWAQQDLNAALLKMEPADADEYVSKLSNALALGIHNPAAAPISG